MFRRRKEEQERAEKRNRSMYLNNIPNYEPAIPVPIREESVIEPSIIEEPVIETPLIR